MTTAKNFPPEHRLDMYQARCTNCGFIQDEYGDYACFGDVETCIESLEDIWFVRHIRLPLPRTDIPAAVQLEVDVLLCPECQECEVCGVKPAYRGNDADHLICEEHEAHEF